MNENKDLKDDDTKNKSHREPADRAKTHEKRDAKTENQKIKPAEEDKKGKHGLLGITAKRDEDFSEWYQQVIQKAELADYSAVSGCIVYRPYSYAMWEKIQAFLDAKFKKSGVKNAYFPLLIPENLLKKEKDHVQGFSPEVAWVTEAGDSKLAERLAVRPTSETIMYDSYSKWIRSYRDLPLRLNQWNSVVRWEFKYAVPFLRGREFLWQEGHTVFATREEADAEVREMLDYYAQAYEELLAVPVIKGVKSESEKFAGAEYTTTLEIFLPQGKAIQGCTSHNLGQHFAKVFDVSFLDKEGEKKYGWQNSWGYSTRSIGIMIMMHGDDKGLVLPPRVAPVQVAIVPILFDKTKEATLEKAREIREILGAHQVILDEREEYTPGFKFNEWEMKGVPVRIEIGPKDIEKGHAVLVRRDTGEKKFVRFGDLKHEVEGTLKDIQKSLFDKAKKHMTDSMADAHTWEEFLEHVKNKKLIRAMHCGDAKCEEEIKDMTEGVKTLCMPFDDASEAKGHCVRCGRPARYRILFAKSY